MARAVDGGVTAVMLREHDLSHDELVRLGSDVARECRRAGALFLVNHDVAAAVALGADGIHLGFRSGAVAAARAMVGEDVLVGRSTHDVQELDRAIKDGADYVTFGPVYDTPSKRGILAPCGPQALAEAVRQAAGLPVIALGGVTAERAAELRRTGAAGLACIREILASAAPDDASRRLAGAWEAAR